MSLIEPDVCGGRCRLNYSSRTRILTYLHFSYRLICIYSCSPKKAPIVVFQFHTIYWKYAAHMEQNAPKYINLTVTLKHHCQLSVWNCLGLSVEGASVCSCFLAFPQVPPSRLSFLPLSGESHLISLIIMPWRFISVNSQWGQWAEQQ